MSAPMYQAGRARLLPTMRRTLAWTTYLLTITTMLVVAYGMHQRANAAPVNPTWQQSVVTIDDEATVAAAQAWGAPFAIRYVPNGADITVTDAKLDDMAGGEATKTVDGDRITGCRIVLESRDSVTLGHEVGHCLGLHHDNGHEGSLMYWVQGGNSGAAGVTDTDRDALADLYGN